MGSYVFFNLKERDFVEKMVVEDLIQYRVINPPGGFGVMNEPRIVHLYARRKAVVSEISTCVFRCFVPQKSLENVLKTSAPMAHLLEGFVTKLSRQRIVGKSH